MEPKFKYAPKAPNSGKRKEENLNENLGKSEKAKLSTELHKIGNKNDIEKLVLSLPKIKCVMMVFGGAGGIKTLSKEEKSQLMTVLEAIGSLADLWNAGLIDGGTKSGIMEMNGKARKNISGKYPLLGVAPASKVELIRTEGSRKTLLEPLHTHFGLPNVSQWGDETKTMFEIAEEFVQSKIPVICFVGNGGIHTVGEVSSALSRKWPVIMIGGSKFAADEFIYVKECESSKTEIDLSKIPHIVDGKALNLTKSSLSLIHSISMTSFDSSNLKSLVSSLLFPDTSGFPKHKKMPIRPKTLICRQTWNR